MLGNKKSHDVKKRPYSEVVREQKERKEYKKRLAQDPEFAATEAAKHYGLNKALYAKYGSDKNISVNFANIRKYLTDQDIVIASELYQLTNLPDNNKIRLLGTIVEQNWVMIRQNEAILQNLEAINSVR